MAAGLPALRDERMCLHSTACDLHERYRGVFGEETIDSLVISSDGELAATATVRNWLVIGAERFTRQRLRALVYAESRAANKVLAVLFLCVHSAGRSQMALGWFTHLAGDRAVAWSGGSEPVSRASAPSPSPRWPRPGSTSPPSSPSHGPRSSS